MKLLKIFSAAIILLLYALLCGSSAPLTEGKVIHPAMDITSSHHDFKGAAWSEGEICRVCHTPHNASLSVSNSPLWNHQTTVAAFDVYTSSTMQGVTGQPTGKTKLCLSCHDGTVAIENHGGYTGGTRYATFGNVTTNLKNDHPVYFIYNTQLAQVDGELYDPSTTPSGLGGTIEDDLLDDGILGCTSCHDVHVSRNTRGCIGCHSLHPMSTKTLSLKIPNDGSQLCLTCHKK